MIGYLSFCVLGGLIVFDPQLKFHLEDRPMIVQSIPIILLVQDIRRTVLSSTAISKTIDQAQVFVCEASGTA